MIAVSWDTSPGWWDAYPWFPCAGQPEWELVQAAMRHAGAAHTADWLGHLAITRGQRAPALESVLEEPTDEDRPHMWRLIAASMGGSTDFPPRACELTPESLDDYASRYMWSAIDALREAATGDPVPPSRPPEEPQHPGPVDPDPYVPPPAPDPEGPGAPSPAPAADAWLPWALAAAAGVGLLLWQGGR